MPNPDNPEESADRATAPRPRSKHGVPRFGLATAEEDAKKFWSAARTSTTAEEVLARAIKGPKGKASGGAWRTKMAGTRTWGLIESSRGQVKLSPLGLQIVDHSDQSGPVAARRQAVLNVVPYAEILRDCDGTALLDQTGIVARFEFQYAMGEADAKKAAKDFEESVRLAGFVDESGGVSLLGKEHAQVDVGDIGQTIDEADETAGDVDVEAQVLGSDDATGQGLPLDAGQFTPIRRAAPSGTLLKVSVDMSEWAPDDVLRVLRALGYPRAND